MPAPTTTRRLGTSASSSAPVEETIFFSSTVDARQRHHLRARGDQDVLRRERVLDRAVVARAPRPRPAFSMRPVPWNEAILFLRNRKATPLVVASTTSPLRFMNWAKSSVGGADLDAVHGEIVRRLLEQVRGLQQRLGRDAADIEAGAAEGRALLDHRHLHAELRWRGSPRHSRRDRRRSRRGRRFRCHYHPIAGSCLPLQGAHERVTGSAALRAETRARVKPRAAGARDPRCIP